MTDKLESDFSCFTNAEHEHPAFADFKEMMHGKQWGAEKLREAWTPFATGWNCAYQSQWVRSSIHEQVVGKFRENTWAAIRKLPDSVRAKVARHCANSPGACFCGSHISSTPA